MIEAAEGKTTLTDSKEEMIMALSNLFGWGRQEAPESACGAADKPAETPAACGAAEAPAACGAGDKPEEKPAACGTACGAGDR